jgi:uridylate kinase
VVFNITVPGNLLKVVLGEPVGTLVSAGGEEGHEC